MIRLELARDLRTRVAQEARAAFPRECCGLIEGVREYEVVRATHVHATHNIAIESERFEIDPATHFALQRAARAAGRAIVGCYHSHPNGDVGLSARDRYGAGEKGFVWLVVALTEDATQKMKAYVDDGEAFELVELAYDARS